MKINVSAIGEGLREIRGDRKLREMKELLHLSQSHISEMEKGNKKPSLAVLEGYRRILGKNMVLVFDA